MSLTDLIVLGYLNKGNKHGYEIIQEVKRDNLHNRIGIKMPAIYKSLPRLEEKEFIIGTIETNGNTPPKKIFRLTDSGKKKLAEMIIHKISDASFGRTDFWLSIIFMEGVITRAIFEENIKHRLNHLKNKNKSEKHFPNLPFYVNGMFKMGSLITKAEIETLNTLLDDIHKSENSKYFKPDQTK